MTGQRVMVLIHVVDSDWIQGGFVYHEDGETLAQVVQRGGGCPIPGNIPGQDGQGYEQPDLLRDVPAHCRDLDKMLWRTLPT